MKLVIIESPLGTREDGTRCSPEEFEKNQRYAEVCVLDSLRRGEVPFASHVIYPLVLKDADPSERRLGMEAGFAIAKAFKTAASSFNNLIGEDTIEAFSAVYHDRGISTGMAEGVKRNGLTVELRMLGGDWAL